MARTAGTMCGWELDDVTELGTANVGSSSTITVVSSSPSPASGSYCLKIAATGIASLNSYVRANYPTALAERWHRFKVNPHAASSTGAVTIFRLLDGASNIQLAFTWDPNDNLIRAYRGAPTTNFLGVTSSGVTADQFNLIDIHYVIDTSAGVVEVWIGGNQKLNLTSQNTRNASSTLSSAFSYDYAFVIASGSSASGEYIAFDDAAANDTTGGANNGRVGDGRVLYLPPSGAGSNTHQSIGGSVPAATNYQSVNEIPPDDGVTFVYSATPTTRDTYALSDLPAGATSVNAVEVIARCSNSDAGAGSIGLTVKSSSTTNEATAQSLDTVWRYYRALYETDPATSSAWSVSGVNAMEAGTTVE